MEKRKMLHRYSYRKNKNDLSKDAELISEDDNSIVIKSTYSDEKFASSSRDSIDRNVLKRGSSAEQLESSICQAIKGTNKGFSNSSIKQEANCATNEEDSKNRDTEVTDRSSQESPTPHIICEPDIFYHETPIKKRKFELASNAKDDLTDDSGNEKKGSPKLALSAKSKCDDSEDEKKGSPKLALRVNRKFDDSSDDSEDEKKGSPKLALSAKSKCDDSSDEFEHRKKGSPKLALRVNRKFDDSSDDSEDEKKGSPKLALSAKSKCDDSEDEKKGSPKLALRVNRKFDDSSDDSEDEKKGSPKLAARVNREFDDSSDEFEQKKKGSPKLALRVNWKLNDSSDDSEDKKKGSPKLALRVKSELDDSSDDKTDSDISQDEISLSYTQDKNSDYCGYTSTSSEVSVTSEDDSNNFDYLPDDYENQKNYLIKEKQQIERNLVKTRILLKTACADLQFDKARNHQQIIDAEEQKLTEINETLEDFDHERLWEQLYYTAPKKKPTKGVNLFKNNSSEIDPAYLTPKLEDGNKKLGKIAQATLNREQSLTVERLQDLHGSLIARPVENQKAQDPKGLKVALMPHQQHALAWLQWRERQNPRGGILADEMGLGKTLTMIALVMASIANDGEAKEDEEAWKSSVRGQRHLGGTLVVVPASLLSQWEGEVKMRCKRNSIKVEVYHGAKRETLPRRLAKNDIVLTTYNIVCREYKMCSLLFRIHWNRVILDEAHVIRNHKKKPCESVCALPTNIRWAVTGTPLHNREMDVYSLLKFLQCSPFDDVRVWKRWVDNKNDAGHVRLATVMKTLMLRRTKQELQEKEELPPLPSKTVKTIEVALDHEERLVYDKVMLYSRTLFDQFLTQRAEKTGRAFEFGANLGYESLTWNYRGQQRTFTKKQNKLLSLHADVQAHEILVLLIRLRQVCCHPSLIGAMLDRDDIELQAGTDLFPEVKNSNKSTKFDNSDKDEIDDDDEQNFEVDERVAEPLLTSGNPVFAPERQSSKMKAVISRIEKILDKNDKIIVVSQWVGVLNIVAKELDSISNASYSMFTGSVAVKDRQKILDDFNSNLKNPNILLLSLTAGGVGLNVVGANHMLLIDIHWNPQLESQVQDRIHRFGQTKDVTIYKYICSDTIEERIQALQNKKLELARQILTGTGKVVGSTLSLDDIKSLFGV